MRMWCTLDVRCTIACERLITLHLCWKFTWDWAPQMTGRWPGPCCVYNLLIQLTHSNVLFNTCKGIQMRGHYWYHMYCCDDTKWLPCWFLAPQTTVDCQLETTRSGLINRSRGLWDDWPVCSETLTINMVWCLCLLLDEKLTCPVSLSFVTGDRF